MVEPGLQILPSRFDSGRGLQSANVHVASQRKWQRHSCCPVAVHDESALFRARTIETIMMRQLARINDQQLLATIATFSPDLRNNDAKRAFELAGSIVEYFFGQEWIDKHVSSTCPTNEYLRVVPGEGQATETSTFKIVDFAELLYNLQNVAGLHICIDRLERGVIEPTYAELDLGRMLYSGDVDFRFVEPGTIRLTNQTT
jgi:hypothetical protein